MMNTQLPKGRGAISDGKDTNLNEAPTRFITKNAKTLVIYFSRSGNTEYQAKIAQKVLHADSYELIAKKFISNGLRCNGQPFESRASRFTATVSN